MFISLVCFPLPVSKSCVRSFDRHSLECSLRHVECLHYPYPCPGMEIILIRFALTVSCHGRTVKYWHHTQLLTPQLFEDCSPDVLRHKWLHNLIQWKSGPALVCSSFHNKIPQTRQLKQPKLIFSWLWRLEDCDWVLGNLVSGENSLAGLYMASFLLCPHIVEKERSLVSLV